MKGTKSPVEHDMRATERDRLKMLGKLFQSSLVESSSVFNELYLSHPCEVCLHIYFRALLIVRKLFLGFFAF